MVARGAARGESWLDPERRRRSLGTTGMMAYRSDRDDPLQVLLRLGFRRAAEPMAARSEAPELSAAVDDAERDVEEADEVGAVVAFDEAERLAGQDLADDD